MSSAKPVEIHLQLLHEAYWSLTIVRHSSVFWGGVGPLSNLSVTVEEWPNASCSFLGTCLGSRIWRMQQNPTSRPSPLSYDGQKAAKKSLSPAHSTTGVPRSLWSRGKVACLHWVYRVQEQSIETWLDCSLCSGFMRIFLGPEVFLYVNFFSFFFPTPY